MFTPVDSNTGTVATVHPHEPDAVFSTVLHDIRASLSFITDYVSYKPETVHLELEENRQDIKDAASNYLIDMPTPNKNRLDAADETVNYITALFQSHHCYPVTTSTPTGNISSPDTP